MVSFTPETIQKLFGKEDAEHEVPERLKEYFFRNKAYENLTSNLAIRILVGHKGTGKSALLKVAHTEDLENNILSLWLRPDDVRSTVPDDLVQGDLNARIVAWKNGLTRLITREISELYGDPAIDAAAPETSNGRLIDIIEFATSLFKTKLAKGLNREKRQIVAKFLDTPTIRVYIDDLDRGWKATESGIQNISAMLNALRDMCGYKTLLQFRIGLRSDVYYLVRTSDESTDKIEQNIIFLSWDNHDIMVLAAKRIESFFARRVDEMRLLALAPAELGPYLHPVIEPTFNGEGKWERAPMYRVLLSLVRQRPRDLVKLLSGAAREAYKNNHDKILTPDLRATFEAYSNERLQDLVNEFRTELPNANNLLRGMRPLRREKRTSDLFMYSNDQLSRKLRDLIQQNRFLFTNHQRVDTHTLGQFLYKIDFITARKEMDDGFIVRKYFDQNRYLQDQFVDFGFDWEVHPAYRWALQPAAGPFDIINQTPLVSG